MMTWRTALFAVLISSILSGCNTTGDVALVFVQTTTVGISASATGGQATPELTVGYRDADVALVPVTKGDSQIRSVTPGSGGQYQDALSVLGQFQVGANATSSPNAALGKFFATGTAASKLAEGYRCQLSGNNSNSDPSKCAPPAKVGQ
jgi:hypothetical protein